MIARWIPVVAKGVAVKAAAAARIPKRCSNASTPTATAKSPATKFPNDYAPC